MYWLRGRNVASKSKMKLVRFVLREAQETLAHVPKLKGTMGILAMQLRYWHHDPSLKAPGTIYW